MAKKEFEQQETLVLSELDQVRILADPLRVRILEVLCREEMTTKQVAESLGEKPTKLYHHVDALQGAGLIQLTNTRQNRGTLEKYYRAVARSFQVDSQLFSGPQTDSPLPEMISSVLERTREELSALMASDAAEEIESKGLISFCEIDAPADKIEELRTAFEKTIREISAEGHDSPRDESTRRFRLTLAFFPLDR